GASVVLRVYNVTQNNTVASITITAGSNSAISTTMSNPSVNSGDVIRLDCTSIGSGTPGSNATVLMY
ncbi:MAG: hypothetical protein KGI08_10895, partial [Thaumarchaeota archaeon]|nr:hypothetical protein [Nitrososphaerota archaeon]